MKQIEPCYLFVYGTLRRNLNPTIQRVIENGIEWLGNARIDGKLFDMGSYPAATPLLEYESGQIIGEVIRINDEINVLQLLDEYEGYDPGKGDSEYIRKKEEVILENGKTITAWIYWYNRSVIGKTRITNEDYLNYIKKKSHHDET